MREVVCVVRSESLIESEPEHRTWTQSLLAIGYCFVNLNDYVKPITHNHVPAPIEAPPPTVAARAHPTCAALATVVILVWWYTIENDEGDTTTGDDDY